MCDEGAILLQKAVDVLPGDTPETPAAPRDGAGGVENPAHARRQWYAKEIAQMNVYEVSTLRERLLEPEFRMYGRGIVLGKTAEDGQGAALAYFIMGRSANSRNRVCCGGQDGARAHHAL